MKIEVCSFRPNTSCESISLAVKAPIEVGEPFQVMGSNCGYFRSKPGKFHVVHIKTGVLLGLGSSLGIAKRNAQKAMKQLDKTLHNWEIAYLPYRNTPELVPASKLLHWLAQ